MKPIDKALKDKQELSDAYNIPVSSIVWIGENKYIIIKDGKQIFV